MGSLQLNNKPEKEKVAVHSGSRQSRKRLGFYASLCNDVKGLQLSSSESHHDVEKPRKKLKHQKSKYYSCLAEEVAAMNLLHSNQSKKKENTVAAVVPRVKAPRNVSFEEPKIEELVVSELEGERRTMCLEEEEEPPLWFNKAVDKVLKMLH